jgi:DNA-binding response OmpR family regulator
MHCNEKPWVLMVLRDPADARAVATAAPEVGLLVARSAAAADAAAAARGDAGPLMILVDVDLPDASGFETARRLRRRYAGRGPAIAMLSARTDDETRTLALLADADAFLVKPLAPEALRALVVDGDVRWRVGDLPTDLSDYRSRRRPCA